MPKRLTRDAARSAALVASSAFAAFFAALFFFLASELAVANGRLARAEDVRAAVASSYCASALGELRDLRARRSAGALPPVVRRLTPGRAPPSAP